MVLNLTVYLSNQLEFLYQVFKIRLFENKNAFARRLVVVPSPAIKSWLMIQMANDPDLKIASGIEICYLDQALAKIYEDVYQTSYRIFPSQLSLSFKIEGLLLELFESQHPLFDSVREFTLWSKESFTLKGRRRLASLADQLANLFSLYAIYGQPMLKGWKENHEGNWQACLWSLLSLPENEASQGTFKDLEVFLFALSFIPQSSFNLIERLAQFVKIQLFQLAPCQFFWSDLLSEKEGSWLLKQLEQKNVTEGIQEKMEELLLDKNPLLANLGRLGRHMLWQLEESGAESMARYGLPQACQNFPQYSAISPENFFYPSPQLSLLQAVQADILLLRNPELDEAIQLEAQDASIQIHVASTKMREIQILYDCCLNLLDRHGGQLFAKDILVMAPDIMEYAPFIKAVFGCSSSQIDFQIMDLSAPSQNRTVQVFLKILDLAEAKWESLSIFELLDYAFFCEKHQFTLDEIDQIKKWFLQTNLSWGISAAHRQSVIKKDYEVQAETSEAGTWDFAFKRLLKGLALDKEADDGSISLEQSQSTLLGRWILLWRSLQEDLNPINQNISLTLEEWSVYLHKLCEAYIFVPEEEVAPLESALQELAFAAKNQKTPFPFSSIKPRLAALLEQQHMVYRETQLHAVKFCSLLPMRAIPSQVIALVGMNENAFPKVESKVSLDQLADFKERDYRPSKTDYDRYLFLEAILSARQYLLISYISYSSSDPKPQPPSLLVAELIHYADQFYRLGEQKFSDRNIFKHPFYSFDPSYFEKDARLHSFSYDDYLCAKAISLGEKERSHQFIKEFNYAPFIPREHRVLYLKDLIAFAKNPLKSYFNQTLRIFLKEEEEFKREEALTLNPLMLYDCKKMGLKYSAEQVIEKNRQKGQLPQGLFEKIAIRKIDEEIARLDCHLKALSVEKKGIFQIHMIDNCRECHLAEGHWEVPPLKIETENYSVSLVGDFPMVSSQGLLSLSKDDRDSFAKIFPEFLVFSALIDAQALPIANQLLMLRSGEKRTVNEPMELLKKFISYYFSSLDTPSPLIPEWIYEFMRENQINCQQYVQAKVSSDTKRLFNEYLEWIKDSPYLCIDVVDPEWKVFAHEIFEKAMEEWYPSRYSKKDLEEKE